jgi:ABC-type amino acid transport system permease subunit
MLTSPLHTLYDIQTVFPTLVCNQPLLLSIFFSYQKTLTSLTHVDGPY